VARPPPPPPPIGYPVPLVFIYPWINTVRYRVPVIVANGLRNNDNGENYRLKSKKEK
jgi:hypothetical protein